ncbi:hypothetical protein L3X38_041439 [Prunus dulcis]|uniref:Uncharacterized protein n=1 Tax=Prunus dulcis TaxID=3755 RepID=A0AAD4UUD5_PRUDU|nr:hypothetical protein L3X38_041439 [Prunus dulcis]
MAAYTTFKRFLPTALLALTMPFLATRFTVEETDVLKGYCDEAIHVKSQTSNPPSPPSSHDPTNVFTTLHLSSNLLLCSLD